MCRYDRCPYCGLNMDVSDVYETADGIEEEGFATYPECHKAFVHTSEVTIDFNTYTVNGQLSLMQRDIVLFGKESDLRRKEFLEEMLEYNKKIDEGLLTEKEIEEYKDIWSEGYE